MIELLFALATAAACHRWLRRRRGHEPRAVRLLQRAPPPQRLTFNPIGRAYFADDLAHGDVTFGGYCGWCREPVRDCDAVRGEHPRLSCTGRARRAARRLPPPVTPRTP